MRADRLLSILLLLQRQPGMKTRELAKELEVSERSVLRDMDALSAAGIPVYAKRGAAGGWYLAEGYRSALNGLAKEEMMALLLLSSSRAVEDLGKRRAFERAIWKLLSALPLSYRSEAEQVREKIHVDGAGWYERKETTPSLSVVQEAVWAERKLRIEYKKDEGIAERIVHPLGLVVKGSIWYLVACVEEDIRTYRVSRIVCAQMTEETFRRPPSFRLAEHWEQSMRRFKAALPSYPAVIRATPFAMQKLESERYVRIVRIHSQDETGITAEADFETLDTACAILLGIGPDVTVLEPPELRERIISRARDVLDRYEGC